MSTPTLILGNNKWAIEEDNILGYAVEDRNGSYLPREISFTRGSDATFTTSTGVIRQACWNLLQYSEQFDNVYWSTARGTITPNATISPTGIQDADTFVTLSGQVTTPVVFKTNFITFTGNTAYTLSLFAKVLGDTNVFKIAYVDNSTGGYTGGIANYNLSTQAISITQSPNSSVTASMQNVGNGWYRLILSFVTVAAPNYHYIDFGPNSVSTNNTFGIWGAQLVQGSDALGYLRTTDRLNMPRVDSSTGTKTFLLEPQRTNLFLWSSVFTNGVWVSGGGGTGVYTDNFATSPDGTQNAARWTTAGTGYQTRQNVATINTTATLSVWMRTNSGTKSVSLFINDGISGVSTITVTTTWQRFTVTAAIGGTLSGGGRCGWYNNSILTNTDYVEVFGAQYEVGAYPTTYIPTQATTVTRIADSFIRSNIYTNGYIGQTGGTWFVEFRNNIAYTRDNSGFIGIGDTSTTTTNSLVIFCPSTSSRLQIAKFIGTVGTTLYTTTTETTKIAIKWNGSTADVFVNGTKVVSATVFTTTVMEFLQSSIQVPAFIQQMKLYSAPLDDAECISITTL